MNSYILVTISKLSLYIAGGGLSSVFLFMTVVNPKNAPAWTAAGPALIGIAGAIGTLFPQPAKAVEQNAAIVTASGATTGATNLSSTTDLFVRK